MFREFDLNLALDDACLVAGHGEVGIVDALPGSHIEFPAVPSPPPDTYLGPQINLTLEVNARVASQR